MTDPLFEYLCRLGDTTLVLGHRLSEWCGHAPALEEDIAVANIALDLIGQTQMWLGLAAEVEGKGRSADDLAMLRDVWEFRNLLLAERPNTDFGHTVMRQFLFDPFHLMLLNGLTESSDDRIAAIAAKAAKEVAYHVQRSSETVIALGDGTEESHRRIQAALDALYPYVGEMFVTDQVEQSLIGKGIAPDISTWRSTYDAEVNAKLAQATLTVPENTFAQTGGKTGRMHSEHLGHMLTQMQWLQRAYPGATW